MNDVVCGDGQGCKCETDGFEDVTGVLSKACSKIVAVGVTADIKGLQIGCSVPGTEFVRLRLLAARYALAIVTECSYLLIEVTQQAQHISDNNESADLIEHPCPAAIFSFSKPAHIDDMLFNSQALNSQLIAHRFNVTLNA